MFKKSISSVLIASVTLAVVLAVGAIILYVTSSSSSMTLKLQQQGMNQVSTATQAALDGYMGNTKMLVETLAVQKAILEAFEGEPKRAKERLQDYIKANKDYWAIFLFDAKGTIIAGYNALGADMTGQSRADRDYVKAVVGGQDLFVGKTILKAKSGEGDLFIFALAKAIKDKDGKLLGGVGAFPRWETFTKAFIDPPRFGARGYGFMLDAKGRIIAHAMDKSLMLQDLSEHEFIRKALELKNGAMFYDWKGEKKFLTVSTDPDTGWAVCMSAYFSEMTEVSTMQRNILLGIGLVAVLLLVLVISLIIKRLVVQPITDIEAFTHRIAQGDFKAELRAGFKFELASLADNIRSMVAEIKNKLGFSQGVLMGIPTPCGIVGPDFKMLWANQQVCDLLEKKGPPSDFIGQQSGEFYWGDPNRETMSDKAIRANSAQSGKSIWTGKSGREVHVDVSTTPFYDLDGAPLGSISFWSDITEIMENQKRIEGQNEKIARAAEAATAISDQVASASEELSAQIEQSSRGTEEQRARTGEAATAMEEMNATVMEVAKSASGAAEMAEQAKKKAQEGAQLVDDVVSNINQINTRAEALKVDMGELGKQAEGIGAIMNVISDIADQTNLLALNAAIEAARAGDAGRGFAVVADEVRKLAEKTMTATNEVGAYIKAVQDSAKKNIEGTEATTRAIVASTTTAGKSGEALREIVGMVDRTADQVRSIATASEEQSAASEEISHTTEDINRIAAETAQAMNESAAAVSDLSRLAQELKRIISNMQN
ncbi:MAG: chemotaxis protein [Deltaproteobacteria bacterium HGW-Deltaproteobacteria-8]|jgi:methyl-accepting chemotaxis protein|nr:MAG: chemotaxis protein [Deltaproteobacteria bacterium HGW-Deltaproteobacteria-8]